MQFQLPILQENCKHTNIPTRSKTSPRTSVLMQNLPLDFIVCKIPVLASLMVDPNVSTMPHINF